MRTALILLAILLSLGVNGEAWAQASASPSVAEKRQLEYELRTRYTAYFDAVKEVLRKLKRIRSHIEQGGQSISLQMLGAATNELKLEAQYLDDHFGEDIQTYQSYKLIKDTITVLDDVLTYWQTTAQYQLERPREAQKAIDTDYIATQLKKVLINTEQLQELDEIHNALKQDITD